MTDKVEDALARTEKLSARMRGEVKDLWPQDFRDQDILAAEVRRLRAALESRSCVCGGEGRVEASK